MATIHATIDAAELDEHMGRVQAMARTLRLLQDTVLDHPEGARDAIRAMARKAEAIGEWLETLRPVS